jgi:hypothetical protein
VTTKKQKKEKACGPKQEKGERGERRVELHDLEVQKFKQAHQWSSPL